MPMMHTLTAILISAISHQQKKLTTNIDHTCVNICPWCGRSLPARFSRLTLLAVTYFLLSNVKASWMYKLWLWSQGIFPCQPKQKTLNSFSKRMKGSEIVQLTVSPQAPWQHSRLKSSEKKETQNGRCWSLTWNHIREKNQSWGSVMSGNWSRGTDQGNVGPTSVACSNLLISHLLTPSLMIWGQTCLCPSVSTLFLNLFHSLSCFVSFHAYFIHRETLENANVYTCKHFSFLISHSFSLYSDTDWENPYHTLNISLLKKET